MPLKEPKEIRRCLARDKCCSSWLEGVLQETSWETWSSLQVTDGQERCQERQPEALQMRCLLVAKFRKAGAAYVTKKRSHWTRWHLPLAPEPATEGTQHCCELRKLCNGFLASVQSLQVPELHQSQCLCSTPPHSQSFLATSVLGVLFRNLSVDTSAFHYSVHDGDLHTSYAHKAEICQHTPTENRYRKIRVCLYMKCSISMGAH